MLNHTYTSVKNANLVDCGKKQHIPSQPSPLLRDNFLGEFRTELDKKKVLANLGIATSLSLEWEYIKGDIGRSEALIKELDSRTKYISEIDGLQKTVLEGIQYLETVVGGELDAETEQDNRLTDLETSSKTLYNNLENLKNYLESTVEVNIEELEKGLNEITENVNDITNLIQISTKAGNALILVGEDEVVEGETPGLYVPDLSDEVASVTTNVATLQTDVKNILDTYVTKEQLGGEGEDGFNFIDESTYNSFVGTTNKSIADIRGELNRTVKTGEDGHVDTLYVNTISKNNDEGNIKITDSFEVESGIPLDVRFVVSTRSDLAKLNVKVCYVGMGVIVKDESALYILREPSNGKLTQEFIENIDVNWKCPEDLVTQALTREEYEALLIIDPETGKNKINPTKFYYIYEEDTEEPKRSNFDSDEAYQEAYNAWLKILSQEYMSAAWGVEIETKVAKKANQTDITTLDSNIKDLQAQIDLLSGDENGDSVSSISKRLSNAEANLDYLLGTEGTDEEPSSEGKIVEIEQSIESLKTTITDDYVSIDSITTENNNTNYIFVKKSDYEDDKTAHEEAIKQKITTEKIIATSIDLNSMAVSSNGTDLLVNAKEVALVEEVPIIKYLTQAEYDTLVNSGQIDPDTYYYTTNEEIYVTKTEFDTKITQVNTSIKALSELNTSNNTSIASMQSQIQTLLDAVAALEAKVAALEGSTETQTN